MNVWCCITALLIWLFRKSIPRSMCTPPVNVDRKAGRGAEGAPPSTAARAAHAVASPSECRSELEQVRLELAREHATTDLRVVERQRLGCFDGEILECVQEGALETAARVA